MRPTRSVFALFSAIALLATPVLAQPLPKPDLGGPEDRADDYFRKGKEASKAHRLEEAYGWWTKAWALKQGHDVACNLGNVEVELGKPRDAAEHLTYCLNTFPVSGDPERREMASKRLRQALGSICAVKIETNVKDATIAVDGKEIGRAPLDHPIYLEPGARVIEAKLAGYRDAHQDLTASAGATPTIQLTLEPAAAPAASTSTPPPVGPAASNGHEGAPDEPRKSMVPAIALGAVGVVGVGVGIGLLVASGSKESDARDLGGQILNDGGQCLPTIAPGFADRCQQLDGITSDIATLHDVGLGVVVGGAVALAGAGAYALFWPSPKPSQTGASIRLSPLLGGAQRGFVVGGGF